MLQILTITSKFTIVHNFTMLYHFKQKVKAKQLQYKNYYSFTQILHKGQDAKKIMKKLKKDLHKADKNAFCLFFEVENRDDTETIFFTSKHRGGVRHIHGLIYTDYEIDIKDIHNPTVKSNYLKNKEEYAIQDSTKFIDYIFHKHTIFNIFHNNVKKLLKKSTKFAVLFTYTTNMCFKLIKLRYKGQAVYKYTIY